MVSMGRSARSARVRVSRRAAGAVALALVLLAAGCGSRDDAGGGGDGEAAPGITDDTIRLGGSFPLSGPISANGQAQHGGLQAFFEAVNEDGGVEMFDGNRRRIELVFYDDAYEPARSVQNFHRLVDQDQVFALVGNFGTPGNAAVAPLAAQQQVPNVYVASGTSQFSSDREANPWTTGWQPTYLSEGEQLAEYLVSLNRPLRVGVLSQSGDLGDDYVRGFEQGIEGSQVEIVGRQTHEPADATADSQIANLAQSNPDVYFGATGVVRLQAAALQRMQELGWRPITLLPTLTSGISQVVQPSGVGEYVPELISAGISKQPDDPQWSDDQAVTEYLDRMRQHSPDADPNIPNAHWGYATGDTMVRALEAMDGLTRQDLLDAMDSLQDVELPILLPGITVNGASTTEPPVTEFQIQRYQNGQWQPVEE